jgi:hypothetical protein
VQDVRGGLVDEQTLVRLEGMLVTAVEGTSFYAQDASAIDPAYSGIYAFVPDSNPAGITIPAVGDVVTVVGEYGEFYGQSELTYVRDPVVTGEEVPEPTDATPDSIGDEDGSAGARAEALEAVLVRLAGATVTDIAPVPGAGDDGITNEIVVDGELRVDDRMYLVDPFPAVDDVFDELVGVVRYGHDHYKLEPRRAADVAF